MFIKMLWVKKFHSQIWHTEAKKITTVCMIPMAVQKVNNLQKSVCSSYLRILHIIFIRIKTAFFNNLLPYNQIKVTSAFLKKKSALCSQISVALANIWRCWKRKLICNTVKSILSYWVQRIKQRPNIRQQILGGLIANV